MGSLDYTFSHWWCVNRQDDKKVQEGVCPLDIAMKIMVAIDEKENQLYLKYGFDEKIEKERSQKIN